MKLYYFHPSEFIRGGTDWYHSMDKRLLVLLDTLRHQWEAPIHISPHHGALGRNLGTSSKSQHNVDYWGEVRAADVQPVGINKRYDADRFLYLARDIGFTGIGLYPDWEPTAGLHLDTRHDTVPDAPQRWGAYRTETGEQAYISLNEALELMA